MACSRCTPPTPTPTPTDTRSEAGLNACPTSATPTRSHATTGAQDFAPRRCRSVGRHTRGPNSADLGFREAGVGSRPEFCPAGDELSPRLPKVCIGPVRRSNWRKNPRVSLTHHATSEAAVDREHGPPGPGRALADHSAPRSGLQLRAGRRGGRRTRLRLRRDAGTGRPGCPAELANRILAPLDGDARPC
jgi:hypothetical protein